MGGIDGPDRKLTSRFAVADDDIRPLAPAAPKPAPIRSAPWNDHYDKVPDRAQAYDPALFAARTTPSCTPLYATANNAGAFVERGIPVSAALQHSLLTSASDLERFLDDYVARAAARPELKSLHDDALRTGPMVFAKRLDVEAAEQLAAEKEAHLHDQVVLMQVRPPLVMQQRAAVGEVVIPVARTVVEVSKFVPIVGELVMASEALTGRDIGGLGEDLSRTERLISGACVLAPFAIEALGAGVRGAAQLARASRAAGLSTEETRNVLRAALAVKENEVALREAVSAQRAGRTLTVSKRMRSAIPRTRSARSKATLRSRDSSFALTPGCEHSR